MSEQNILNPSNVSLLNPDYGYTEGLQELRTMTQSMSGKLFMRRQRGAGRIYQLVWKSRGSAVADQMRQWENQYRDDFFTLADWIRGRYFSGHFQAPLTYSPSGNEQYDIKGNFEELPTVNMYQYPANWTRDATFLYARNGFGDDLVKLTGTWNWTANGEALLGSDYLNANTNTTDKAEWVYFGYGCRIWSPKGTNVGIFQATVTRVRDGATVASALVDLYSPSNLPSQPVFGENLLEYSQAFDNAIWTKNGCTVTANTTVAPDGATTADTLAFATAGLSVFNYVDQQVAGMVTVGVPYTFSVWLKAASAVNVWITVRDLNGIPNSAFQCNLTTSWQRFSVTVTPQAGASATMDMQIYITNQAATTVFAWGAQLERDVTAPLDYIPTTAAGINMSLPLDTYRVAVQATNSKNSASSNPEITADALQVMQ
jgi:hypothetical protein